MNSRVGWVLPTIAVLATALAVGAGSDLVIAIPAAGLAVLAADLLFVGAWLDARDRRAPPTPRSPHEVSRLRLALRSGPLGREDLVLALDRLERSGPNPDLLPRTGTEVDALVRLPPSEFRQYLRQRLDDLEIRM
jgi:hypothetical protein